MANDYKWSVNTLIFPDKYFVLEYETKNIVCFFVKLYYNKNKMT